MTTLNDRQAKQRLGKWPNESKIWSPPNSRVYWLRAQPAGTNVRAPRLTVPGSLVFQTQPDGLWLSLGVERGDTHAEARFADCIVIESCGNLANLYDKRSRYAARTTSLVVDIRRVWLDQEVVTRGQGGPLRARRELLGGELEADVMLPVRSLRTLYAVPDSLYARARGGMILEAHEFMCAQKGLGQYTGKPMQRFLKGMGQHRQWY